ncbi:MAG: DnaJ domain-containing protein [Nitrososphaerota archaeon]
MDSRGYYAILGVSEHASYKEIRRAYRCLARKYHPDRNNNSDVSDDRIKSINAAFEILSNTEKRKRYDKSCFGNILQNEEDKVNDSNTNYHVESDTGSSSSSYRGRDASGNVYPNNNSGIDYEPETTTTAQESLDIPKSRFHIIVEPSLCMAFGSCERLAPKVFVVEKEKLINPKAIVKSETGADFETILAAAQTCPTKAIVIIDRYTGEQIFP